MSSSQGQGACGLGESLHLHLDCVAALHQRATHHRTDLEQDCEFPKEGGGGGGEKKNKKRKLLQLET